MDCRILRQLTLKADGHLCCDDSVGYAIDLGMVRPASGWRAKQVLEGPIYSHVRRSFREGAVPWPGTCESCDLFSDGAQAVDTLDRSVNLHVEPTLACTLKCACCTRNVSLNRGRDTACLDPAVLDRLVRSLVEEGITVGQVEYAGHGEPLLHDQFPRLVDVVRRSAPLAPQVVTTTGNVDFASSVGHSELDLVVFSCDGAYSESYARYRVGGSFPVAMQFLKDARRLGWPKMRLEWKYILFEFNDSDEELRRAQRFADEFGVDSLLFIITNSKWRSRRFGVENIEDFPIISTRASVHPAAALNAIVSECPELSRAVAPPPSLGQIDLCNLSIGRILHVEGWAAASKTQLADKAELLFDGRLIAQTRPDLRRNDVQLVHTALPSAHCGFDFRVPATAARLPARIEVRISFASGSFVLGGPALWTERPKVIKNRKDMPGRLDDLGL